MVEMSLTVFVGKKYFYSKGFFSWLCTSQRFITHPLNFPLKNDPIEGERGYIIAICGTIKIIHLLKSFAANRNICEEIEG